MKENKKINCHDKNVYGPITSMIQGMDNDHFFYVTEHEHAVFQPVNYDYIGE